MVQNVLVTGHAGYIGSVLVPLLVADGYNVTGLDTYYFEDCTFGEDSARVADIRKDIRDITLSDLQGFDAVIHCVSTTTPKSSNESPEFDIQSNVIGTLYLLDICVKHNIGKLVFLSSGGTIYGDIGDIEMVDETHPVRPMCSYGVSKLTIEHYLDVYRHLRGLDYVALRLSNPYGERQSPLRALGALTVFLHRTLKGQHVEVWGDGGVTRDYIYVGDVANAVYLATVSPISGIFNVGTGTGLSLHDILNQIKIRVGREPIVEWLGPRPFDVPRIVLDATKLKRTTDWSCHTNLEDGIAITADWLRNTDI